MTIRKPKEEKLIREAADISMKILFELGQNVRKGAKTIDLDNLAGELCRDYKVKPAFKNVSGYDYNTCISINDEILHGIPDQKEVLEIGDLVKIDFGIIYKKFHTDHCWTFAVEQVSKRDMKLLKASREATENAVEKAISGNFIGDLGYEMNKTAKNYGYNTVKEYVGHGIGKNLHEDPEIPSYGQRGIGELLEDGMIICVECQVVDGSGRTKISPNGWTVKSLEGGKAGMYEYMVIVRDKEPEILTPMFDWPIIIK